jgi:MFS family permease
MQNKEGVAANAIRSILTRDFLLGFLALFLFTAAFTALFPTLPIFFAQLGSNEREIGVLIGIFGISALVFRLLAGGALTKYSERKVMMFGASLFAVTFIASILLRPFWPFFAVRVFQGAAVACMDTAAFAFIIKTISPAYRGQSIGYLLLAPNFSMAIMPSFAMFFINRYSFTSLFLICMGMSLCSLFVSWKVKEGMVMAPERDDSANGTFFFDLKIVVPALSSFLQTFVWGSLIAFVPLYALQCKIENPGYFFSAIATMLIAGRTIGGRIVDTYKKETIMLTLMCIFVIAMVILSFSKTLPMLVFVGLFWGTGVALFVPASMAYSLDYAGSSSGVSVGTFRAFTDLGQALGPVTMGIIIPLTGYRIMFLCLALICFINLCYFQFYVRKRHNTVPTT